MHVDDPNGDSLSCQLFRRLQLQVLLISTVEKSTAIQPYCDITYSIVRHGDANAIAPFIKLE